MTFPGKRLVVVLLVLAAWSLAKERPTALRWLLCAGSAGTYLAAMDVLYDLEHGIWWNGGGGGVVELVMNMITVAGSTTALVLGWRHRASLLAGRSPVRPS